MQTRSIPRKRPAPGTAAMAPAQNGSSTSSPQRLVSTTEPPDAGLPLWDGIDQTGGLGPLLNKSPGQAQDFYSSMANSLSPHVNKSSPISSSPSTKLVRRYPNQQTSATPQETNPERWRESEEAQGMQSWAGAAGDEIDVEQQAIAAKEDALSKRKQIPPFVRKLSSFLDESRNTELIRWSDDGNSFVVLDEDEFARTLIPELFKHNNYASFVRQLNMYGFHKRVGLSDNSLRSSERKTKAPSEYFNKHFKRGSSDLLWLVQKPKNISSAKRPKKEGERGRGGESDDDGRRRSPEALDGDDIRRTDEVETSAGMMDVATIPKSELQILRQEVQALQRQQQYISKVLQQVRQQNEQLYTQATAFQTMHDRHESSINAILTFLATFYNQSLEGHGKQSLVNMFANAIPQHAQQGAFEMADIRRSRRPLALLPAPDGLVENTSPVTSADALLQELMSPLDSGFPNNTATGNVSIPGPSKQSRNSLQLPQNSGGIRDSQMKAAQKSAEPTSHGTADVMSAIKSVNAVNNADLSPGSYFDISTALDSILTAGETAQLTPQERNDTLSKMAANQNNGMGTRGGTGALGNVNNALVSPTPPPIPSLDQFSAAQDRIELLQKLQERQSSKVQSLAGRLQPLSPTGSIPGLNYDLMSDTADLAYDANGNILAAPPSDFDLDAFINADDYMPNNCGKNKNTVTSSAPEELNFDFDLNHATGGVGADIGMDQRSMRSGSSEGDDDLYGTGDTAGTGFGSERVVESLDSGSTSSVATGLDEDDTGNEIAAQKSPAKRLRRV